MMDVENTGKEHGFLTYESDLRSQPADIEFLDVDAVKTHHTLLRVVEAK